MAGRGGRVEQAALRVLAVVQAPITGSLPAVRQLLCTSIASVVTLLPSMTLTPAFLSAGSVITLSGA